MTAGGPMNAGPKICVVGSSNIDLISRVPRLPRLGETLVGHSFHLGYGGKGANQAVMAAKRRAGGHMVHRVGGGRCGEGALPNTSYERMNLSNRCGVDEHVFGLVSRL